MKLTDFKVLTFDCYGTLIDWESGMVEALKPLVAKVGRPLSRDEILEAHARHESAQQLIYAGEALQRASRGGLQAPRRGLGRPGPWDECVAYGRSVRDWPAFADSAAALRYLKQHYKLVILSNVDNESFCALQPQARRRVRRGLHRRGHRLLQALAAQFRVHAGEAGRPRHREGEILHTAESLFHDHAPANDFGLATCWIHRRHAQGGFGATMNPGKTPRTDFRFTSMAEMAEAHRRRLGAAERRRVGLQVPVGEMAPDRLTENRDT